MERSWPLPLQWSSLNVPRHSEKDSGFALLVDVACVDTQAPVIDKMVVVVVSSAIVDCRTGILHYPFATVQDQASATVHGVYAAENLCCIVVPDLGIDVGVGESDMALMQGQVSGRDVRPVPALL